MQLLDKWDEETDSSVFPLWAYSAYPHRRAHQEQPGHEPPQHTNSANPKQENVTVSSFFSNPDPAILTLHGFPIDTVAETSAIITRHCLDTIDEMTATIKQMRQMIHTAGLDDSTQDVLQAFAETLIARRRSDDYADILDTFFDWAETIQFVPTSSILTGGIETPSRSQLNAYRMQIVQNCTHRRFFTTPTGRMGLGPSEMQPTDVVAVVQGSTMPLILRPKGELAAEVDLTSGEMSVRYYRPVVDEGDVAEEYRFVGLAYVHGVMEGEAVSELRGRGVSERVFEVR